MSEAYLDTSSLTPWELEHGEMLRDGVDIISPHTEQTHYEAMIEALRREGPITPYPYDGDPGYGGFWVVTDNALARAALSKDDVYSSHGLPGRRAAGLMIHDLPEAFEMAGDLMIMLDDPAHHRQRRLVDVEFRRTHVTKWEDFVTTRAHELVRAAVIDSEVDFVESIAAPLPLAAIAEVLSIPAEQRDEIYELGNNISLIDTPPGEATDSIVPAAAGIIDAAEKVRYRVKSGELDNPALTSLSDAIYRPHKGEEATEEKFITCLQFDSFFILLFLAGNETTRNSLAHGIQALASHPGQWDMLKRNPELLDSATDEIVRWATPVRYIRRTALEDTVLGGAEIRAGDKVVISLTGANRDPTVFKQPHEFDITRDSNELRESLAFGFGTHFCLGRQLAKLEIQAVLREMLAQVDSIDLLGSSTRLPSTLINNVSSLPVRLNAA